MQLSRLEREEIIAIVGGVLLAVSVFLTYYTTGNAHGQIDDKHGSLSAWDALQIMRFLFLAAAAAPLILGYIVMRGHALSWPRGEVTAVVSITAVVLILVRGVIIKPGGPTGQIHLGLGWYLGLLGALVMLGGSLFHRAQHDTTARKPPGVM